MKILVKATNTLINTCRLAIIKTKKINLMKKVLFTLMFLLSVFAFLNLSTALAAIEIPDNVQQIINKSCYDCHNSSSSNKKAIKEFNFDKLNFLKKQQAIVEWDKVTASIIDGEMPPKKFNKKHPDKRLTMTDKQVLTNWIKTLSEEVKISLSSQLEKLTNQIISSLDQNKKNKIAIMEFVNMQGKVSNLGKYISEELTTRLYLTGKFEVIERQLLDKIIEEQKISMSGMIDESSAVELGRVLGVDAIASGTITDLGTSVKVNARLISAESGKLFSVASVEIPKNDKVKILLSQSVATTAVAGATASGSGAAEKTVKPAGTNPVVTKNGFRFELLNTSVDGERIIFKIKLSNPGDNDKTFHLFGNIPEYAIAFDDLGREYYLLGAKFANKSLGGWFHETGKRMVAGTSMIMELSFEDEGVNPQNATRITLLQLWFYETQIGTRHKVQFRNIPLNNN